MLVADLLVGQRGCEALVEQVANMLERELSECGTFHFFKDHAKLPADADCTALGLLALLRCGRPVWERAMRALDTILANVDANNVVETYLDPTGERSGIVDAVVCVNVLRLAHALNRWHEASSTWAHVCRVLTQRSFINGTRYYNSPDTFLFLLTRLLGELPHGTDLPWHEMRGILAERIGQTMHPLDLAQRLLTARWLGMENSADALALQAQLAPDGSAASDGLFCYGRSRVFFGSPALTAAFALASVGP